MSEHDKHLLEQWADSVLRLLAADAAMQTVRDSVARAHGIFSGKGWRRLPELDPADWVSLEAANAALGEWQAARHAIGHIRDMLKGSPLAKILPRHELEQD